MFAYIVSIEGLNRDGVIKSNIKMIVDGLADEN